MLTNLFKHWTYRVFAPGTVLRQTYESFQQLLAYDQRCHELMAELESLYYQGIREDFCKISLTYQALAENVEGMVKSLEQMAPGAYHDLPAYFRKFNFYAGFFLASPELHIDPPFILHFNDPSLSDKFVGSKSKKLAELGSELSLPIPEGFAVTSNSLSYLIEYNDLRRVINNLLSRIDMQDPSGISDISKELYALFEAAEIPPEIENGILNGVDELQATTGAGAFAVRSSALSEDGHSSFAGQYLSCLDVSSDQILSSYKRVISSKYSPEALVYRINCGLSDEETAMAVMVIPMIHPQSAGVMYTADPSGKIKDGVFIHAAHGLGDAVVSGKVRPDVFTLDKGTDTIIEIKEGSRKLEERALQDDQVQELYENGLKIEQYFGEAQDIEWAMDESGSFTFLQTRPLQIHSKKSTGGDIFSPDIEPILTGGEMAASGITVGRALRPGQGQTFSQTREDIILVLKETLPSYVRMLPHVNGVVAESGSAAGHFATVCREFGIPLLLGIGRRISNIEDGEWITLDADQLHVYPGKIAVESTQIPAYKRDKDLPFYSKLASLLKFITPLKLVDPTSKDFVPESCRSLHDIIRFSHEKAVQTMFSISDQKGGMRGVKKRLETDLPFEVFLVDVDNGMSEDCTNKQLISIEQILSTPFQSLWKGLTHPDIQWGEQKYYDWKSYDQMVMSDAFAFNSSSDSASYAVLGKDYLNMNIRFGYHFTVIDSLCEPDSDANYCSLRFAGGGGEFEGRELRIIFLTMVLEHLGFEVIVNGDLLDATLRNVKKNLLMERLESLGRLLGLTKQMDMRLHDKSQVEQQVEEFFKTK